MLSSVVWVAASVSMSQRAEDGQIVHLKERCFQTSALTSWGKQPSYKVEMRQVVNLRACGEQDCKHFCDQIIKRASLPDSVPGG